MADFILLMHDDAEDKGPGDWETYITDLRARGHFDGGSMIGAGVSMRQTTPAAPLTEQVVGYIKVQARNLNEAKSLVFGNPCYEAGGTVEVRELPDR